MAYIKIVQRRKPLGDGSMPIALRITKDRKTKFISLGMSCKEGEFENQEFKSKSPNYRKRNQLLSKVKTKAYQIIDDFQLNNEDFTLQDFEDKFRGTKKQDVPLVKSFFDKIIAEYKQLGKEGNARVYEETTKSLFGFADNTLMFKAITPAFLGEYERYMRARGNQDGGISVKMRTLKALFNKAINRGFVSRDLYPFNVYKTSKLKATSSKRALSKDEFKRFKEFEVDKYPHLMLSYHLFIFSFYTRGMNYIDMMKLTWRNVQENKIIYVRAKTQKRFVIKILPPVQKILDYYKSLESKTSYVFPLLLKDNLSPSQIANRKKKTLRKFNKDLKEIAELVSIDKNITSYVARHSYATLMKQIGVSTDKISESMGHTSIEVTQAYLKEFDNDVIDDANDKLLDL